jgi:hypothetical protein
MIKRVPLRLLFTVGLTVCAAIALLLDRPRQEVAGPVPADQRQPLQAWPRAREHAAILSWIFEHRSDAASLEFLDWSAPRPVSENPFTDGPATLVQVVLKNKGTAEESREYLAFYLHNLEVLGSISQPYSGVRAAFYA